MMVLTAKTKRVMKSLKRELSANAVTFEDCGNRLLTNNCTVEAFDGSLTVNDLDAPDVETALFMVREFECLL